ncbi:hypothetical protein PJV94_10285 [Aliarcobacter butzleri]|uniref:phosphoribosyltransferase-like protein n=1 Tax=Aliarcobacter butzleri TaxID=28197 RepID=UPI00263D7521|nr:hypothetical protein [Aliarcobacter butzleri]MDN5073243.1 hypothetical protein [Aliarcobacter butzleri]MDN5122063.1 hypothetical protein [Aliarcobacter butzleri]
MNLKLPENHRQYYDKIIDKSKKYIKLGYWNEIDFATFEQWLNNFKNDEERYLSALILDKIIYRNDMTIRSMFSKMFHIDLPNILEQKKIHLLDPSLEEWEKLLKSSNVKDKLPFRFTTITSEKELGDSGADYMRRLRRYYLVNRELIIRIDAQKDSNVNTLIIIDDLIASGEQTKTFIEENVELINKYRYVIFMPLMAHEFGMDEINKKIGALEKQELLNNDTIIIKPVEIIKKSNSIFYDESNKLLDGKNKISDIKFFYENFIKTKVKTKDLYGYGSLSLLLIFSTGIPDNTLPIIHESNEEKDWIALYEKF